MRWYVRELDSMLRNASGISLYSDEELAAEMTRRSNEKTRQMTRLEQAKKSMEQILAPGMTYRVHEDSVPESIYVTFETEGKKGVAHVRLL